jgi:hypothetical protein
MFTLYHDEVDCIVVVDTLNSAVIYCKFLMSCMEHVEIWYPTHYLKYHRRCICSLF